MFVSAVSLRSSASAVPRLTEILVRTTTEDKKGMGAGKEALAAQLADMLDFVLQFDQAKMMNAAIMNDFSQYRRSIGKMRDHPSAA